VQHVRAAGAGALRQQQLVPDDAAIETPRVEPGFGQFDDVDVAGTPERAGQTPDLPGARIPFGSTASLIVC